jgi:hypothetical protein
LRRLWRLLGWFIVVNTLITIFGVTTAPLLLSLAADGVAVLLAVRGYSEMRAAMVPFGTPIGIAGRLPHYKVLQLLIMGPAAAPKHSNGGAG